MSAWKLFYSQIRDPSWPDCDKEEDFVNLPLRIQKECQENFGYVQGQFAKSDPLPHKKFPIQTATSCQLKWNWSTIYLTTEKTASCHRTNHHRFDTVKFDFHNTPDKLEDRKRMIQGQWPERGCEYCKNIEDAGGQSDRITNLDFPGMHAPKELDYDSQAINVTPRILEIYFNNTCDLKCLYCGPWFSSLWDAENKKHGHFKKENLIIGNAFQKSKNIQSNKEKLFDWLLDHIQDLSVLNILGGEPLYQSELDEVLDLLEHHPAPKLKLQMFSNLNARPDRLHRVVKRVESLIQKNCLREFEITASLDCWGAPQEYVRFPLNLERWKNNFEYLLDKHWINLIVSSTITPLTIKTLPELLELICIWRQSRMIYHYQNSVNDPSYMFIDIFGDIFSDDFQRALALKPETSEEEVNSKKYLDGIAKQSASGTANPVEIGKLYTFLVEMDRRRGTKWYETFPWLIDEFKKYHLV